jgi:predicted Abi (CAAX) family protease
MASSKSSSTMTLEKKRSLSPDGEEVRVLGISEYLGATQCLAEAFAVDDVARYFIDTDDMKSCSEEQKWKLHVDILKYVVAAHCYKGMVTTIGPDYDAVALW